MYMYMYPTVYCAVLVQNPVCHQYCKSKRGRSIWRSLSPFFLNVCRKPEFSNQSFHRSCFTSV